MIAASAGATMFACGDDGGSSGGVDAKVFMDAPKVFMDAPPGTGLMGLGQKCGSAADCPSNAPDCIALSLGGSASPQYCTPHCLDDGTATTNAMGQFTGSAFQPPPDPTKCSGAYSGGSVGMPACGVLLSYTPMDMPLMNNKQYTMIDLGCVVLCGTGMMCPMGTTARTAGTSCFCFPNP